MTFLTIPLPRNLRQRPKLEILQQISPENIVVLEGEGNYTKVVFNDGPHLIFSKTLNRMQAVLLPTLFIRISKSIVVNRQYIQYLSRIDKACVLTNGSRYSIARRRYRQVKGSYLIQNQ
ncbi:LytTR family DNA-binding domain-containing protein [Runella sp. MFBS21]|uniref:LytR/AlgR family response regulator transcription factor n=1 Tax=Runella sp. MFBS21 TaxID=3034018 RepID=UPI0023FA2391|nr:LytTR family DNA-binding domain-containing protein [Runella sp. MFBS21]MDF7820506.1 LytTR family DNA-binding domain-containing protein [Runella sp. MFBS21]